ncbi:PepSY domain-containing protein [Phaeovulum vinaykumarii]|uniref:PepSY domain-containing protein n=1 Tax=Phaeovulum vinaykumarii TaxID=407234 RepID=A0A1N7M986_9RHOB|nr:PepSY domain-containing protein [Phaeovulum vinaykumarii]SIS82529.1 hypothetical protein SAMN05421795_10671 [Phaeovulum vinaykumarii]SOC10907.1 hypothetical protein SAMN05878426_106119 [Phaeovulum vinaykumarii]
MTRELGLVALSLSVWLGSAALADEDCFVPLDRWQPRAAVLSMAESRGWTVRRLKIDDGCYEIRGRDADGTAIEVRLDPATLEVLELERGHHREGRRGHHRLPGFRGWWGDDDDTDARRSPP